MAPTNSRPSGRSKVTVCGISAPSAASGRKCPNPWWTGPRLTSTKKIVRMQVKQAKRIAGDIKIAVYGKVSQEQKLVPTTAEKLTGGWVKVTPSAPLAAGEYAVVELLGKEGMNFYVWDFGVNPAAPANPMAWKPEPSSITPPPE